MKQHVNFRSYILFLILTVNSFACRQPASKVKQPINKAKLLQLIKKLAITEHQTPGRGMTVLNSFAHGHDLQLIDSSMMFKDTTVVQVRFTPDKEISCYYFYLPKALQKQLTYHDMDLAYGKGIESPRQKEPTSFGVMYHVTGGGDIAVMTSSQFPPTASRPMIYQITVML